MARDGIKNCFGREDIVKYQLLGCKNDISCFDRIDYAGLFVFNIKRISC